MNYLYRISTKRSDIWSNKTPKPIYFVANNKEDAEEWVRANLQKGLSISKTSLLAKQISGVAFVGL